MGSTVADYIHLGDFEDINWSEMTTTTTTDPASDDGSGWFIYYTLGEGVSAQWAKSKDKVKEAMRGYTAKNGKLFRRNYAR